LSPSARAIENFSKIYPIRVIKYQLGLIKFRYKGTAKNKAQLITIYALKKVWMAKKLNNQ